MKKPPESLSERDLSHLKSAIDEAAIVAITDSRGVITYVNKKFCAISKYPAEELVGQTHSIISSQFHPKKFFRDMWTTISRGQTWEGEICNRAKDATLYWVHTTIVPFLDSEGKPEQYVAVRYEITERKKAEEQLKIYAKKLELSNHELQEFASVAAHDLQEPLRKIQSFSDRVKVKAQDTVSPEIRDYLDRIQASAKRMQTLINDLLTYSRVTTQAKPFSKVALNDVVSQVLSDLELRIEQTGAKIEFGTLPVIEADPTQMHQLFLNLLSNALKFARQDEIPHVKVAARMFAESPFVNGACEISVTDNGIGFESKYLERIFVIFQRLHGRHEYEGTGIGLAVCRKIVDRHGGQIAAQSSLNHGATFVVTLPIHQPERLSS